MMRIETAGGSPNMDYAEHERTYAGFIKLVKYSTAVVVLTLIGMAIFLL
jgi:hypothetical protein